MVVLENSATFIDNNSLLFGSVIERLKWCISYMYNVKHNEVENNHAIVIDKFGT